MISANGGLRAHTYTPQVTPRWPRGSEPASPPFSERCYHLMRSVRMALVWMKFLMWRL